MAIGVVRSRECVAGQAREEARSVARAERLNEREYQSLVQRAYDEIVLARPRRGK
jgi:hypothetical protein